MLAGNCSDNILAVSKRAASWEMRAQKVHLIRQNTLALKIDIFCMGRRERDRQQLHTRLFRRTSSLVIVTTLAGCYHVLPQILSAVRNWCDVVTGQFTGDKSLTTVQTNLSITLEQCAISQRWHVAEGQCLVGTMRRQNCTDFNFAANSRARVYSSSESVNTLPQAISNTSGMIKPNSVLIIDPLQRHPRCVCAEHLLRQVMQNNLPLVVLEALTSYTACTLKCKLLATDFI